jgi:hypothetical protein
VVAIAVGLGARRSEVESLDWSGLDLDAGILANHGTKTRGSDRATPIPVELLVELRKIPEESRIGRVVGAWPNVGRDLPKACTLAGIEKATPNDLRRTYASWLVNLEAPLKVGVEQNAAGPWDKYGTNVPETPGADGAPDASAAMPGAAETAASPTRKPTKRVPRVGIEPTTRGFSGPCQKLPRPRLRSVSPRTTRDRETRVGQRQPRSVHDVDPRGN